MFVRWAICRRISFVPLACGVFFGLWLGKWCYSQTNNPDFSDPKITCLVLQRSNSYIRVNISKETWLQKCHNYVIVKPIKAKRSFNLPSNKEKDCERPVDVLAVSAENAWGALCRAFHLLPLSLEWLIVTPDSSFVIIENLKEYVRGLDWRKPRYLGHAVNNYLAGYNILSAGIVLSNGSVTRLLSRFNNKTTCDSSGKYWNNEDMYLGAHLQDLGVKVEDTRDSDGGGRFHGYNFNTLLFPGPLFRRTNYFKRAAFPIGKGLRCCSKSLITIDTSDTDNLLLIQLLLYGVKLSKKIEKMKKIVNTVEPAWVKSLREIGYKGPTDNLTAEQYYDIWARHIPPEELSKKFAQAVAP